MSQLVSPQVQIAITYDPILAHYRWRVRRSDCLRSYQLRNAEVLMINLRSLIPGRGLRSFARNRQAFQLRSECCRVLYAQFVPLFQGTTFLPAETPPTHWPMCAA